MPKKDPVENQLKKLQKQLDRIFPEHKYIEADDAKFVKLISNQDFLFATTERNDQTDDLDELFKEEEPEVATGNRIVIYTVDGEKFYNKSTLSEIDKKFKSIPQIIKTHASFIINLQYVHGMKRYGARGYLLMTKFIDKEVPVSQTYLSKVKKYFGI